MLIYDLLNFNRSPVKGEIFNCKTSCQLVYILKINNSRLVLKSRQGLWLAICFIVKQAVSLFLYKYKQSSARQEVETRSMTGDLFYSRRKQIPSRQEVETRSMTGDLFYSRRKQTRLRLWQIVVEFNMSLLWSFFCYYWWCIIIISSLRDFIFFLLTPKEWNYYRKRLNKNN